MAVTASTDATDSPVIFFSTSLQLVLDEVENFAAREGLPHLAQIHRKLTSLPVTGPARQTDLFEIARGDFRHLLGGTAADLRQAPDHLHHKGRLVAFAPVRHGRQVRAIRLHQQPVLGGDARRLPHRIRLGERQHAAEGQIKTAVEGLASLPLVAREAVQDAGDAPAPAPSSSASVSSQASRV